MTLEEKIIETLTKSEKPLCLPEISEKLALPDMDVLKAILILDKEHKINRCVRTLAESDREQSTYYYIG